MAIVLMAVTLIPSLAPEVQAADGTSSGDANDLASIVNGTGGDVVTIDLDKDTTYTLTGNSSITKTSVTINGNGATLELASSVQFNAGNGGNNPDSKLVINNLKIVSDESTVTPIGITFYNWTSVTFDKLYVTNTTVATNDTSNTQTKTNVVEHCTFNGFKDQSARYYALTLNSSTVEVSDCHFYDYSCGLNINMVDGDADSSVTVNGCTFNNMQGKAAVQLGGSVSPSIVLEGNQFLTCSRAAVSIHEGAVGSTTVTSMNNIYSDCGMEFMYCSSKSDVKVVSVSDQFTRDGADSDPVIGGETASVQPPVSNVSVSDGYDPSTGNMTIDSIGDLMAFAAMVNGGNDFQNRTVTLESDLTLFGEWTPIGDGTRSDNTITGNVFRGTFDGQGNTISGMTISTHSEEGVGLFAYLVGGTVKNLTLSNPSITTTQESTGAVVGAMSNGAQIIGVHVKSGSVNGTEGVGGIVGRVLSSGSVTDCSNSATVEATVYNAGGIAGAAYYNNVSMTISGCTNDGIVKSAQCAGGIVGLCSGAVTGCTNNGEVTGNGTSIGGIVGEQQNSGSVTDSTNKGAVTNTSTAYGTGGVIGWVRYSGDKSYYPDKSIITISNAKNCGDVDSEGTGVGGIVGMVYHSVIMNGCTSDATISGSNMVAGIVGGVQTTDSNHTPDFCRLVFIDNHSAGTIDCAGTIRTMVGHLTGFTQGNECTLSHGSRVTEMGNTSDIEGETGFGDFATVATIDFDGETYGYENLQSAFDAVEGSGTITLVADIEDCPRITLDDGGDYVLDLNEHTITFVKNAYFLLNEASLDVTGSGTIKEGSPYYGVFMIKNTADATPENDYIHLTIGENVTAQGWAPVFIDDPATSDGNAYGVTVDVYGKLESVLDTAGAGGHAIYINGQNTSTADYPVINIYDGAKITSKANGVYIAGYTEFNMYGGSITGVNVGIEIRAGILNIEGGSIEATSNTFSTISNGNGSTTSGVAVAVSQHTTALNIDVNITDGDLKGLFALYQASAEKNNDSTKVDLSVTGGTFTSTDTTGKYASVGAEDKTGFITGGIFKNSSGSGDTSLNRGYLLASGFDVGSDGAIILESGEPTVATINGTPYGSINDAINAADPGDTIVLKVDLVLSSEIRITDSNITLDLGRHSISGADDSSRNFNLITIRGDDVTIRNGTLNGSSVTNQIVNVIQATGVKLNGLTIDNSNGNPFGYPIVVNGSEVVLSGSIDLIATFYGINLDQGGSVTEPVKLTFASDSVVDFNSTNGIFAECAGTALVLEEGSQYDSDKSGFVLLHGYDVMVTGSAEYLNENHRWVVTINPDKDGSTVTVTGSDGTAYAAQDDGKYHLPAGEFTVTASTAGYSGSKTMPLEGGVAGGSSTFSVEMSLNAPSVNITKGEQADDGSVTLSAVASHEIGVTYTYQWSDANGVIQGATAATYDAPGPGTYSVSVTASDGTETSVAEATVTVSAPAPKYDVQIVVTPSDATVTIDGQTVTGTSVQLVAGTYQVVVSKDGYTSVTETIEVGEGLANRIEVHLEAVGPEDPDTPVYPPIIPGGDDDDVVIPPTVVVDQGSSDDDEAVKIVACAACAVVAAFLAAVMLFHRRD